MLIFYLKYIIFSNICFQINAKNTNTNILNFFFSNIEQAIYNNKAFLDHFSMKTVAAKQEFTIYSKGYST